MYIKIRNMNLIIFVYYKKNKKVSNYFIGRGIYYSHVFLDTYIACGPLYIRFKAGKKEKIVPLK